MDDPSVIHTKLIVIAYEQKRIYLQISIYIRKNAPKIGIAKAVNPTSNVLIKKIYVNLIFKG